MRYDVQIDFNLLQTSANPWKVSQGEKLDIKVVAKKLATHVMLSHSVPQEKQIGLNNAIQQRIILNNSHSPYKKNH